MRAGESTPAAPNRIPTSSQRPGKRSNDTVPYARFIFTEFHGSAADPTDILPGDLVFVHRTSRSLGHDSNRASKVATWRQLNAVLSGNTAGVLLSESLRNGILQTRLKTLSGLNSEIGEIDREIQFISDHARVMQPRQDIEDRRARLLETYARLDDAVRELQANVSSTPFLPEFDWQAVPFVSEWVPDGILMSRDDDEQNSSFFHSGGGDAGTVLNIAVNGVSLVRNAQNQGDASQSFDSSPVLLDDVYVLLVATPGLDGTGSVESYSFKYKVASGRVVRELVAPGGNWAVRPDEEYPPGGGGLSHADISQTVHAWRIGRIMDSRAVKSPFMQLRINVSICSLSRSNLMEHFDSRIIGSSVEKGGGITAATPTASI